MYAQSGGALGGALAGLSGPELQALQRALQHQAGLRAQLHGLAMMQPSSGQQHFFLQNQVNNLNLNTSLQQKSYPNRIEQIQILYCKTITRCLANVYFALCVKSLVFF